MTLHVLFTGLVSKTSISGGDQLFLDIAPHLPKDIKLVLITPSFAKKYWEDINQSNVEFRYLRDNPFDSYSHQIFIFLSYLIRSWQVYQILRKEKEVEAIYSCSDIVYADIWPAYFLVGHKKVKWLTRIYHVILPPAKRQGNFLVNFLAFYLQRLSFWMIKKRSNLILALNDALRKELLDLGFPKNRIGVLGAGIDYEKIRNFKPTKKYIYDVVALGRVAPVKGIFDIVKIWKTVHDHNPSWKFAWVGGGNENYTKKMRETVERAGLEHSFSLLGFIDKEEVYNILKSAKVFVCPDHENGWGLAICEAMASGLPVVSYNIDIFGSVYKKGYRSVPLFDTKKFSIELIKVLEDNSLRKMLGEEAQDQAAKFDHSRVIKEFLKYLKENGLGL